MEAVKRAGPALTLAATRRKKGVRAAVQQIGRRETARAATRVGNLFRETESDCPATLLAFGAWAALAAVTPASTPAAPSAPSPPIAARFAAIRRISATRSVSSCGAIAGAAVVGTMAAAAAASAASAAIPIPAAIVLGAAHGRGRRLGGAAEKAFEPADETSGRRSRFRGRILRGRRFVRARIRAPVIPPTFPRPAGTSRFACLPRVKRTRFAAFPRLRGARLTAFPCRLKGGALVRTALSIAGSGLVFRRRWLPMLGGAPAWLRGKNLELRFCVGGRFIFRRVGDQRRLGRSGNGVERGRAFWYGRAGNGSRVGRLIRGRCILPRHGRFGCAHAGLTGERIDVFAPGFDHLERGWGVTAGGGGPQVGRCRSAGAFATRESGTPGGPEAANVCHGAGISAGVRLGAGGDGVGCRVGILRRFGGRGGCVGGNRVRFANLICI